MLFNRKMVKEIAYLQRTHSNRVGVMLSICIALSYQHRNLSLGFYVLIQAGAKLALVIMRVLGMERDSALPISWGNNVTQKADCNKQCRTFIRCSVDQYNCHPLSIVCKTRELSYKVYGDN